MATFDIVEFIQLALVDVERSVILHENVKLQMNTMWLCLKLTKGFQALKAKRKLQSHFIQKNFSLPEEKQAQSPPELIS